MAGALFRAQHRLPMTWAFYLLFLLCVVAGGSLGRSYVTGTVLGVVVVPLLALLMRHGLVRQLRAQVPPGTVLATGFGPSAMALRTPLSLARIEFRAFRSVEVVGDHVVLRQQGSRVLQVLPRQLVPEVDLGRLRAAVAG